MFDWILHNRQVFSGSYVAIGHSFQEAKKLQEEHNQFTMGSNVSDGILHMGTLFHDTYDIVHRCATK